IHGGNERNRRMSRYAYTIQTLAPLHIGTGEAMSALEYYIGDEFIVPDLDRIIAANPQVAAKFSQNLALRSAHDLSHLRLAELLDVAVLEDEANWRYAMPDLCDSDSGFYTLDKLADEIKHANGEVRLATKTPDYRAYIPGSSIKGALKTAWAYAQLLNDEGAIDAIARAPVQGNDAPGRAR